MNQVSLLLQGKQLIVFVAKTIYCNRLNTEASMRNPQSSTKPDIKEIYKECKNTTFLTIFLTLFFIKNVYGNMRVLKIIFKCINIYNFFSFYMAKIDEYNQHKQKLFWTLHNLQQCQGVLRPKRLSTAAYSNKSE